MPKSRKRPAAARKQATAAKTRHHQAQERKALHRTLDEHLEKRLQIRRITFGMRQASQRRDRLREQMLFARSNNDPDLTPAVSQGFDSMERLVDRYADLNPTAERALHTYPDVEQADIDALVHSGTAPMDTHTPWFGGLLIEDHLLRQTHHALGPAGAGWTYPKAQRALEGNAHPDADLALLLLPPVLLETALTEGWRAADMHRADLPASAPDAYSTPLLEHLVTQGWHPEGVLRAALCLSAALPPLPDRNDTPGTR